MHRLLISCNRKPGKLGFDILINTGMLDSIYQLNVSKRFSDRTMHWYTALLSSQLQNLEFRNNLELFIHVITFTKNILRVGGFG